MLRMIFFLLGSFLFLSNVQSQSEKVQIMKIRNASNAALRVFDLEADYGFLTDDVLITTGEGALLCGKEALKEYLIVNQSAGPRMYWVRTTLELDINAEKGLAYESGTWKGFNEDNEEAVVGGKYSAMWTKVSGKWLIKSQLFVTLPD